MPKIPHIIHQTWKTTDVPAKWLPSQEAWKAHHPTWEYRLWTDADNRALIESTYPWFLAKFDSYPYNIQRADAIRYFILNTHGGVYSDLDLAPTGPIDAWIDDIGTAEAAFVGGKPHLTLTNAFMASAPQASVWPCVFNELVSSRPWWASITRHVRIMMSTGPLMINNAILRCAPSAVVLLPRRVFPAYDDTGDAIVCASCAVTNAATPLLKTIDSGKSWCSLDSHVCMYIRNHASTFAAIGVAAVVVTAVAVVALVVWAVVATVKYVRCRRCRRQRLLKRL